MGGGGGGGGGISGDFKKGGVEMSHRLETNMGGMGMIDLV